MPELTGWHRNDKMRLRGGSHMTDKVPFICPQCGSTLDVDRERPSCYCTYCGAKIELGNNVNYTYRKIDEARIREADVKELLRLKELEIQSKKLSFRHNVTVAVIAAIIIALIAGILLEIFYKDSDIGGMIIFVTVFGGMFYFIYSVLKFDSKNKRN